MIKFSVNEVAGIIGARYICGQQAASSEVRRISTDSRTIKAGDCFFAVEGDTFDGHNYVVEALGKGAACAVISKEFAGIELAGKPLLMVDDTIKALGRLAGYYRRQKDFKVIAITGSAGKTTTRQIISSVLCRDFKTHQAPKNFNNQIGLPLTILSAPADTQVIVTELGTNRPGEISYLSGIAKPDIAVITNIYPAHLEGFGSLEEIAKEKASIANGLKADGLLIINSDFPVLFDICSKNQPRLLTFGEGEHAQIRPTEIHYGGKCGHFNIDDTTVKLTLLGRGNILNAVGAWAVCKQFGLEIEEFAQRIEKIKALEMRSQILAIGPLTVINDCYNANPASMQNALEILTTLTAEKKQRSVFICGDMNELGKQAEMLHIELGKQIVKSGVELLITVGRLSQFTAHSAKKAGNSKIQMVSVPDSTVACNILENFIKETDIILVKGSRTNRLEVTVEKLKELFSTVKTDTAI